MYVYICTDTPCMYVCMFTYINIHTLPPSSSHLYTHTHTHTCRSPETARGNILDLKGRTREFGKIGGCNTSNLIFRISERRTSSRLSRQGEGHSLQRILHARRHRCVSTFADTHTSHIPRTHWHLSWCDSSEKRACINARSRARVNREIITLRGANARAIRPVYSLPFPSVTSNEKYKRGRR